MSEWFKVPVLKTGVFLIKYRGFESSFIRKSLIFNKIRTLKNLFE